MKRLILLISAIFFIITLSACNNEEANDLETIYNNALEASEELKSFEVNMNVSQKITIPDLDNLELDSKIKTQMTTDPQAFHQVMEVMGSSIEMYYKDNLYIQQSGTDQWLKAPRNSLDQFNQLSQNQQTPFDQLIQIQDYINEFNLKEQNDSYVLTFSSDGEETKQLIKDTLEKNFPEGGLTPDMLEGITINNVHYSYTISKNTYYPEAFDVELDINVDQGGEQAQIYQKMSGNYSKHNEISEITVPHNVIENAEEMPM